MLPDGPRVSPDNAKRTEFDTGDAACRAFLRSHGPAGAGGTIWHGPAPGRPKRRVHSHPACPLYRAAFASATVSAVMLMMRRTVADGVKMCTGWAAPSRTGPIAMPPPAAVFSRL